MKLNTVKDLVENFLKENPVTRGDDDLLYMLIIQRLGVDLDGTSIRDFFECRFRIGLPSFESVRRARQKAQADNEELLPCEDIVQHRRKCEKKFYKFAKDID